MSVVLVGLKDRSRWVCRKKKSTVTKAVRDPQHLQDDISSKPGESSKASDKALERVREGSGTPKRSASIEAAEAALDEGRTEAEKRFLKEQRRRVRSPPFSIPLTITQPLHDHQLAAKVAKDAKKSHKDRVAEFNAKLEAMSEHHGDCVKCLLIQIFAKTNVWRRYTACWSGLGKASRYGIEDLLRVRRSANEEHTRLHCQFARGNARDACGHAT